MKHLRKWQKPIASLLLIFFLQSLYVPVLAVTGGPGQPEYTSFESAGGSEMVNMTTGDFTYNLPILRVPGPSGGYSMSLFYHAGIKVEQVASWVGLGWNMNPGAINRSILGQPDDWKAQTTNHMAYQLLAENHVENSLRLSVSPTGNQQIPLSLSFGYDWGNNHGYGFFRVNGIGAGGGTLASYKGAGIRRNMKSHFGTSPITIPLGMLEISGAFSHSKYDAFISANGVQKNTGILHTTDGYEWMNNTEGQSTSMQQVEHVMDAYANPFSNQSLAPTKYEVANNLAFPAYDAYIVNAEGLNGKFSPKFNQHLTLPRKGELQLTSPSPTLENPQYHGAIKEALTFHNLNKGDANLLTENRLHFQFDHEKSSYDILEPGTWTFGTSGDNPAASSTSYTDGTYTQGSYFNSSRNKRSTSQPIEWFTNRTIDASKTNANEVQSSGFMEYTPISSDRMNEDLCDPDGIGGFVITTAEGLKYHFALPIYQFESLSAYESITDPDDNYYVQFRMPKYATTWLLTAVTGTDFVDRGVIGQVDDEDWGYWVKFNYGKWSDGYLWRTPYSGHELAPAPNEDKGSYALGRKQLYYLNEIETATHKAYFVKALRKDAKGAALNNDTLKYKWNYSGLGSEDQSLLLTNTVSHELLRLSKIIVAPKDNFSLAHDKGTDLNASIPTTTGTTASFINFRIFQPNETKSTNITSISGNKATYDPEFMSQTQNYATLGIWFSFKRRFSGGF